MKPEAAMLKMKSLKHQHFQLFSNPANGAATSPFLLLRRASFSSSSSASASSSETPKPTHSAALTQHDLTKINLLIPRLCLSDHLTTAIHLTTTSLHTNPPPKSLSISILIHSLTSQPDMAKTMSFLTILRHTPQAHQHLTPITTAFIISYIKRKRPKEALKVYQWMLRPGYPCTVGKSVYRVLVYGLCDFGMILEALRVLRRMVSVGFVPVGGLRNKAYRSLLREARVREAVDLDKAFCGCFKDGDSEGARKVVDLLESMIGNWQE